MSNHVSPQIDVGQLTFQGLGGFMPMLAALSADDVAPMAVIQLENLGAVFPISGENAMKVADRLQRCPSKRLDRLGIIVGCLNNLFSPKTLGLVLRQLSERLIPASSVVSSPSQLAKVAQVLTPKLVMLGFGNFLAKQVARIHKVYEQLQITAPTDLLKPMAPESVVKLFHALSRALREEDCIVPISGSCSLGYILGLVLMLFPNDCMVSVDNFVVHEGLRQSIFVEFPHVSSQATQTSFHSRFKIENVLGFTETVTLPIKTRDHTPYKTPVCDFIWEGWIVDSLRIEFLELGLNCSEELILACCNLLVKIPEDTTNDKTLAIYDQFPSRGGLLPLLGDFPRHRMSQSCQTVFRIPPFEASGTIEGAFKHLVDVFTAHVESKYSCCSERYACKNDLLEMWNGHLYTDIKCCFHSLWVAVGRALDRGLTSFFIQAEPNATVRPARRPAGFVLATEYLHGRFTGRNNFHRNSGALHKTVMEVVSPLPLAAGLALSESSTIYPALLRRPELSQGNGAYYELVDGKLQHNKQYYRLLIDAYVPRRPNQTDSLDDVTKTITPTSMGEHSSLIFTLEEPEDTEDRHPALTHHDDTDTVLTLHCIARYSGMNVPINLAGCITASFEFQEASPCPHPKNIALNEEIKREIGTTSIASPSITGNRISIVQTAGNLTAQLLACEQANPAIIQRFSCLNCAYAEAKDSLCGTIIAG